MLHWTYKLLGGKSRLWKAENMCITVLWKKNVQGVFKGSVRSLVLSCPLWLPQRLNVASRTGKGPGHFPCSREWDGRMCLVLGRGQEWQHELSHFSCQLLNHFVFNAIIFEVKMFVWKSHRRLWPGFGRSLTTGAFCPAWVLFLQSKLKVRMLFFTSVLNLELFERKNCQHKRI